ncbi:ATP-binding protein [Ruegeria sp.]|uniref:ATP-binding protein n=1 Tax=Ruegeria sp. TaxID=1879320 RepID=UPI003B00E0B7
MQLRKEILELARQLKLPGIVNCFDEVMQAAAKNNWRPQQVVAELLTAELAEKTARSIRYQMGAAKFPVCKSLPEFDFTVSPVNEEVSLTRDMSGVCNMRSVRFYSVSERRRYEPSRSVTGSSTDEV